MARTPAALAKKWNREYVESIPDAKEAYIDGLPAMADNLTNDNTIDGMKANYAANVGTQAYKDRVRRSATPAIAGAAHSARLDQIAVTGLTDAQENKVEDEIEVRQHLARQLPVVVNTLSGAAVGEPTFAAGINEGSLRNLVTNTGIMKFTDLFNTSTTPAQIVARFKTDHATIPGIILKQA